MLNRLINRFLHGRIAGFERDFSYDFGYGHEMLDISRSGFVRFSRVAAMSQHREGIPVAPWFASKLTAVLSEDCGTCTQLSALMAERAGVDPSVIRAVVEGNEAAMGDDVALVWRYTRAVLAHDLAADRLREMIEYKWGKKAVVSLALAIAGVRIFPTVKYAMGHGHACTRVRAGGIDAIPHRYEHRPETVAA
jgi:hypothetical protein